ncbi:MAG: VWA domain-containing protein [Desulfobacterales bacterium]|nr:VWA domain-containing protein [Desulfobacterales bacterium]
MLAALVPVSTVLATPAQVPLEAHIAGAGVEPNIMLLLDTSLSMDGYDGFSERRIRRAKDAFKNILNDTEDVRFCLATFDQRRATPHKNKTMSNGAYMNASRVCGTDKDTLIAEIDNIYEGNRSAHTNCGGLECYARGTPTNSALYDIVQYFKTPNAGPFFGQFDDYANYPDPLLNNCQENVVIIATDGNEYSDWTLANPAGDGVLALPGDSVTADESVDGLAHSLPRWADGGTGTLDNLGGANRTICRSHPNDPNHP